MSAAKPQDPFISRGISPDLQHVAKMPLFLKKCCKSAKAELIFSWDSEKREQSHGVPGDFLYWPVPG